MYIFVIIICFLIAIFLFLIFPSKIKKENNVLKDVKYIAHRGLHNEFIPENSLSAFDNACKNGYAIEIDIHVTKDDEIVVFHDNSLKRMCGVDLKIEDLTLSEIKEMHLLNTAEKIPTLKECLDLVDSRSFLLIEFKCESKALCDRLCVKANEILNRYSGKYAIQSFYPFVLNWYKKNKPCVMRGQLASAFYNDELKLRLLGALVFNFIARPHFISYEYKYTGNFFRRLSTLLGAYPVAWTYNKQEDIEKSKKYFKSYIFEKFIPKKNEADD